MQECATGKFHSSPSAACDPTGTGTSRLFPFLRSRKWQCRLLCRFSDAGIGERATGLMRPASEKRQGTKSREVGQRRRSGRYGDLAADGVLEFVGVRSSARVDREGVHERVDTVATAYVEQRRFLYGLGGQLEICERGRGRSRTGANNEQGSVVTYNKGVHRIRHYGLFANSNRAAATSRGRASCWRSRATAQEMRRTVCSWRCGFFASADQACASSCPRSCAGAAGSPYPCS